MHEPQRLIVPQPFFGRIVRWIVLALFRLLGGLTVLGAENVPRTGPVLICSNHLSDSDSLAIYAALPRRDVYFVANQDLFDIRLLGAGMRAFGSIPIHRESADRAAIRQAMVILAQGSVLVLFPEGHLSQTGQLNKLLPGASLIAVRAQAEIAKRGGEPVVVVPVGLTRTNLFLPYGAPMLKRSRLPARVSFGSPISLDTFTAAPGGAKLMEQVIAAIEQEIRRLINQ